MKCQHRGTEEYLQIGRVKREVTDSIYESHHSIHSVQTALNRVIHNN